MRGVMVVEKRNGYVGEVGCEVGDDVCVGCVVGFEVGDDGCVVCEVGCGGLEVVDDGCVGCEEAELARIA